MAGKHVTHVEHDKSLHDALDIDADTVDGQHASAFSLTSHDHDSDYAPTSHGHNDQYYTESEIDTQMSGKANTSHNHSAANITSGSFDDTRISQSSVRQHINKTFIDGLDIDADTLDGKDSLVFPDATGKSVGKIAETDGSGGWTYIDTPSGGGGGGHPHVNTVEISDGSDVQWEIDLEVDGTLSFNFVG